MLLVHGLMFHSLIGELTTQPLALYAQKTATMVSIIDLMVRLFPWSSFL